MTHATPVRISLSQQIEEIQFQLNRERRGVQSSADARMHVLRLEALLATMQLIRRFEPDVREVIRHGLDLEKQRAEPVAGGAP